MGALSSGLASGNLYGQGRSTRNQERDSQTQTNAGERSPCNQE